MKRLLILATAFVFSLLAPQAGHADFMLTLTSTAPDLTNLVVGQTVHFDVSVSGLGDPGNPSDLAFFTTDVGFSDALLGTPITVTAGAIIPDSSPASFVPVSAPGVAGMIYFGSPRSPRTESLLVRRDGRGGGLGNCHDPGRRWFRQSRERILRKRNVPGRDRHLRARCDTTSRARRSLNRRLSSSSASAASPA